MVDPYVPVAPTPPAPVAPTTARDGKFRRGNPIGYAGAALGLVSLLFNFFCIPSAFAIIFSAIGLAAARKLPAEGYRVTGLGWCVAGLVIGIAETLTYIANATY
jgi:hypothetical protein